MCKVPGLGHTERQPYYPKWLLFPNPQAQVSKTKTTGKTVFKHKALQFAKCWAESTCWLWVRSSGDLGTDPALLVRKDPGSVSFPGPVGAPGISTLRGRNPSSGAQASVGIPHSRRTRLARPLNGPRLSLTSWILLLPSALKIHQSCQLPGGLGPSYLGARISRHSCVLSCSGTLRIPVSPPPSSSFVPAIELVFYIYIYLYYGKRRFFFNLILKSQASPNAHAITATDCRKRHASRGNGNEKVTACQTVCASERKNLAARSRARDLKSPAGMRHLNP